MKYYFIFSLFFFVFQATSKPVCEKAFIEPAKTRLRDIPAKMRAKSILQESIGNVFEPGTDKVMGQGFFISNNVFVTSQFAVRRFTVLGSGRIPAKIQFKDKQEIKGSVIVEDSINNIALILTEEPVENKVLKIKSYADINPKDEIFSATGELDNLSVFQGYVDTKIVKWFSSNLIRKKIQEKNLTDFYTGTPVIDRDSKVLGIIVKQSLKKDKSESNYKLVDVVSSARILKLLREYRKRFKDSGI